MSSTSQIRSRGWCFTLNNPTEVDFAQLKTLETKSSYFIYGKEVGEEGTPHLQGYIYFKSQRTLKSLKKQLSRAHLEVARGTPEQNKDYCSKDGDVYEVGVCPIGAVGKKCTTEERIRKNKRIRDCDLNELVESGEISICQVPSLKKAKLILEEEKVKALQTDDVRGVWIYGPPGTGKTHYAVHEWPEAYMKNQNKWFDGYVGQKYIILDDLDTDTLGHLLKRWLDKWQVTGEVKCGHVNLAHEKFIVTSNYTPEEIWKNDPTLAAAVRRRCKMIHMPVRNLGE